MKEPLVSILINNYNYGRYLRYAIESALSQTYAHIEIIVVDDGSTDDSRKVIAQYQDSITSILKENGGQASAFNAGFLASQGDLICLLDSDDCFRSDKVAKIVETFEKHDDASWCFHPVKLLSTDDFAQLYLGEMLCENAKSEDCQIDFRSAIQNAELPTFVPATSGLCFTRSILKQILPMPESEGVSISDLYIKYIALSLGQGYVLDQPLTFQGIHDHNAYTGNKTLQQRQRFAQIDVLTAYYMRTNFSHLGKLANKLIARGIGNFMWLRMSESKYDALIQTYLLNILLVDKLKVFLFTVYYYFKALRISLARLH